MCTAVNIDNSVDFAGAIDAAKGADYVFVW